MLAGDEQHPRGRGMVPLTAAALAILKNRSGQGGGCQSSGEEDTSSHFESLLRLWTGRR